MSSLANTSIEYKCEDIAPTVIEVEVPGIQGPSGQDGRDGKDGADGKDGIDGKDASESIKSIGVDLINNLF